MLEDGSLTPRMLLPDVPTHYEGFQPENFDRQYRGAVRADEALAHSLNVPAVRMLKTYGIARFADLLRGAGMSTLTRPADHYGLTLILGGAEGNLWDISAMYASLADIARAGAGRRRAPLPRTHGTGGRKSQSPRPLAHRHGRGLADARRLVRGAAPRRRRPLEKLRLQSPHRLEDRHQRRPARRLGGGQHFAPHGGRVGGQCQRRRPPGTHRLDHGRAADVRASSIRCPAEQATGSRSRCTRSSASTPAPTTASSPTATATPNAPGCRATATSMRSESSQPARAPRAVATISREWRLRVAVGHDTCRLVRAAAGRGVLLPQVARRVQTAAAAARGLSGHANKPALALLYPDVNARVLIPRELDGARGRTVFEAVHRRREARIYWHLDGRYLGETHTFHQPALDIDPGEHILTLVDDTGERVARRFAGVSHAGVVATRAPCSMDSRSSM